LQIGRQAREIPALCDVLFDSVSMTGGEGSLVRRMAVRIARDTVTAWIERDRVWRIDIQSDGLQTADSIHVGTPMSALVAKGAKYLGYGEGGPYVELPSSCGLSFEVGNLSRRARSMRDLPAKATVRRISIVGC
jgi:hypothetical protein